MRLKLSTGPSLVVSPLFGVLGLLLTSCGGDEPVSGTSTPPDNTNDADGSDESGGDETEDQGTGNAQGTEQNPSSPPPAASTTETGSTLPDTPAGTAVGVACVDDSDCVSPLACLRSDESFRGTLPGTGICTMPCNADTECQAVDVLGFCDLVGAPTEAAIAATAEGEIPEGMAAYCLQACPFGYPASKCDDLATFACTPIEAEVTTVEDVAFQFGLCLPLCSGDDDCDDAERCDPVWGLCVPDEPVGKGLGEKCDPSAEQSECAGGICLGIDANLPYGLCTAPCNVHPDTIVCGGEPGTDAEFGCFSNLFTELASSSNDLGQCLPLCDADDDCSDGLACDLSGAETLSTVYGREGVCFPTEESVAEAVSALSDGGGLTTSEPEPPTSDAGSDGG